MTSLVEGVARVARIQTNVKTKGARKTRMAEMLVDENNGVVAVVADADADVVAVVVAKAMGELQMSWPLVSQEWS